MDTLSKDISPQISFFKKSELDYILLALLSGILFFISVYSYGLGITNDSVNYLSAAQTLSEGMRKADGTYYTEWPPLFPVVLSLSKIGSINILLFASILNGLLFITINMLALYILKTSLKNKSIYCIGIVSLLFSIPILQMHVMLWSEPLFMLLIVINSLIFKRYKQQPNILSLLLLLVIGILMYLQRKTGIIFIATTSLLILFYSENKKRALFHSMLYVVICSIPIVLWYKRRHDIAGKILGEASFQPEGFLINLREFLNTLSSYFIPSALPLSIRLIFLLLFLIVLILLTLRKNVIGKLRKNLIIQPLVFTALIYYSSLILFLIYIQIDDQIDDRILAPVYLLLLLAFLIFLDTILEKRTKLFLIIPLCIWLLYPIARTGFHLYRWNTLGTGGYNSQYWKQNSLITYALSSNSQNEVLFTNNIYPLKYFINFKAGKAAIIYDQEKIAGLKSKGTLFCFAKEWTYPEVECMSPTLSHKKRILQNQDGEIWQLNNR